MVSHVSPDRFRHQFAHPGLARAAPVADHDKIAEIGGAAAVVCTEFWWPDDVARDFCRRRDEVGTGIGVGRHDLGDEVCGDGVLA